jgi:imidazolonepropionase
MFCESGYFTVAETEQIMEKLNGLHQNSCQSIQFYWSSIRVKYIIDHLEVMTTEDIEVLKIREQCPWPCRPVLIS